jgi:anti-anti-sigma factor
MRDGFRRVVLDRREATFIDSTGIHAILDARCLGEELDVAFALVEVADPIERVFAIAGIGPILHIVAPDQIDERWA